MSRSLVAGLLALAGLLAGPAHAQRTPARAAAARAEASGPYTAAFRDAPLREALAEVVRLTDIDLVYPDELVGDQRTTCRLERASAEALLGCVLAGTGLDFVRSSSGAYVLIRAVREVPPRGALAGRVVDAATGRPLPRAHVWLAAARPAAVAGADGLFALADVEPGRYRVVATHVGYEPAEPVEVGVEPGAARRIELRLRARAVAFVPVVVDGLAERVPSAALGRGERRAPGPARSADAVVPRAPVGVAPGVSAAGVGGTADVARGAALVLGVSAALPTADLHVQGGSTAEHVTRLDGVPVRDPVALGRHLGAFSPLALGRLRVHTAAFGVEHGSALAGAVDAEHDLGGARPEATLQADPLSVNARVSGPVGARGAAMAAVRQSAWAAYRAPALASLLERWNRLDPVFTSVWLGEPVDAADLRDVGHAPEVAFSDVHAAVRLHPEPFGTLSASLYRARNHVAADRTARLVRPEAERVLAVRDVYDWTNGAAQASYTRLIGARVLAAARVRGSRHASESAYRFARSGAVAPGGVADSAAAALARVGGGATARHRLDEYAAEAEAALSLGAGREVELRLGAEHVRAEVEGGNRILAPFRVDAAAWLATGHARTRLPAGPFTVDAGVRLTGVPARRTVYAEPRLSVRLDATPGDVPVAARLAGGVHRQFVNGVALRSAGPAAVVTELLVWLPPSADVAPARAFHGAAEVLVQPGRGWSLRADVFGRHEPRLLALDVPGLRERLPGGSLDVRPGDVLAAARGHALGGGVRAEQTAGRLRWAVSASAERVRRTVPGQFGGRAVPTPWEAPRRLSGEVHAALGRGLGVSAAGSGVWGRAWGFRHAYYDLAPEALGDAAARPETARLPALAVLDAAVHAERRLGGVRLRAEVGVTNLLGRANVFDWSASRPGDADPTPLPRGLPGRQAFATLRLVRD